MTYIYYKLVYEIISSGYICELMSAGYLSLAKDCAKHCTHITSFNLHSGLMRYK